ncbi:hypothetical protein NRB20_27900 [Nocardia sp. RB20]|uniref:Uncharacterized protein n=1 Tax=Nocardia macrotermitis TaxID=2585198 RepID=A0A7K0D1W1_9NOCA|nr:hypothetical protein [Nocardia macrotermitis]
MMQRARPISQSIPAQVRSIFHAGNEIVANKRQVIVPHRPLIHN